MRRIVWAATALILMGGYAAAQGLGEKTGINAALGSAPSTADFVKIAATSDLFEIESSKLASARADASGKQFATKMIADHTKTSEELKALAPRAGVQIPTALDSSHQSKLDKLKVLQGAAFDKEYDSMQVAAHEDAVSLFERYAKGGDNAELKAFAAKYLPHLQDHLRMAKNLRSQGTTGSAPR